jgi:ATP-dependent Clp protease ATP-binding subunit ClpC
MFEQFTELACQVMGWASEEAARLCHDRVGTEHILLAVTRLDSGVAFEAMNAAGVDYREIRHQVEKIVTPGTPPGPKSPVRKQTAEVRRVVEIAIEVAREQSRHFVGTGHLLASLLVAPGEAPTEIFRIVNIDARAVCDDIDARIRRKPDEFQID